MEKGERLEEGDAIFMDNLAKHYENHPDNSDALALWANSLNAKRCKLVAARIRKALA